MSGIKCLLVPSLVRFARFAGSAGERLNIIRKEVKIRNSEPDRQSGVDRIRAYLKSFKLNVGTVAVLKIFKRDFLRRGSDLTMFSVKFCRSVPQNYAVNSLSSQV